MSQASASPSTCSYRLTFGQALVNPPELLAFRAVTVAVLTTIAAWLWHGAADWTAWAAFAALLLLGWQMLFRRMNRWTEPRTLSLGPEFLERSGDDANPPVRIPLRQLTASRGIFGTVVLRQLTGHNIVIPCETYVALGLERTLPLPGNQGQPLSRRWKS